MTSQACTPALPTATLTASPTSIIAGASSTLTWSSTTAVSCTASGGWTGAKALSGSQAVTPTATTTYTLTCTNVAGSASQSATVSVTPATTLTAGLTASPTTLTAGSSSTLTATVGGTATGTINYTFYCNRNDTGTNITTPYDGKYDGLTTTSRTHTCTYSTAGTYTPKVIIERGSLAATQIQTVTVNTPVPTVSFSASPTSIITGQSSTLTWSSTNATSCTASNGWSGSKTTSGSQVVTPAATTTYSLTCTGPGGTSPVTSVSVSVGSPAPTLSLSASPTSIVSGNSSTLTWSSTNATSCTASGGWTGAKALSGSQAVTPTATTTYTLTCTGPGGTVTRSATVTVTAAAPTLTFSASPTTVASGSSSTLTWSSTNATSCTASNGWSGSKTTSGSQVVTPAATTTYSLTCTGPGGTSPLQSATVTVNPVPTCTLSAPATNQTIAPSVSVAFAGSCTDSNGTIAAYEWRDGNCATGTLLSTVSSFSTTTLTTTGTHPVYFRARDNQGAWSTNCPSRTITVQSTPPAGTCLPQNIVSPLVYSCPTATTANLTWNWAPGVAGAVRYELTVDDNSDFSSPLLTNQSVTAPTTSYTMNSQTANRMYYGRVRSVVNTGACSGTSVWSATASVNAVCPLPTLTAGLSLAPTSGNQPLNVTLTGTAGGTETGTINYTFYCNRSDTGTNITTPYDGKYDGVLTNPLSHTCLGRPAGTYTAKVIIERGSLADTQTQTYTVAPPLPTVNLTVDSTTLITGQSTTLRWTSGNSPTSCTASGGWSGTKAVSGSQSITPSATTTYTLTCAGASGTSAPSSVTVTVNPIAMTFQANGGSNIAVFKNKPVTLSWSVNPGTATCDITSTDGSTWTYSTSPTSATQNFTSNTPVTYTLSCRIGTGPSQTREVTVSPRAIPTWEEVSP